MSEIIIKILNLTKKFESKTILNQVNLEIKKGEAVAFVGENGTGKSTLLKLIAGFIKVSSGQIIMDKKLKIAYIPERFDKTNMTIPEFLFYMGGMDGLTKKEIIEKSNSFYEAFFLEDMLTTPMKYLSKGTLQKVAVIQALLVQPDILLLDEPLSGQDYHSQKKFIEKMLEYKDKGVTILLSCHEPYLIDSLANRVLKIENKGLTEVTGKQKINLPFNLIVFLDNASYDTTLINQLSGNKWIRQMERREGKIRVLVEKEFGQELCQAMLKEGYKLLKFGEV